MNNMIEMIENTNIENIFNENEKEKEYMKPENHCSNYVKEDIYFENIKDKYESNLKSLDYEYSNDYNGEWGYGINNWKNRYKY